MLKLLQCHLLTPQETLPGRIIHTKTTKGKDAMGIEEKLVRKRLETMLGDEEMVTAYLRTYGPHIDMAKVNNLKASRRKVSAVAVAGAGAGAPDGLEDPTYTIQVKCPICATSGITCYELKSKSLVVVSDRFNVPRFNPMPGFQPLNYNLYSVTVCTKCLFASPDKKDFITWSIQTKSDVKSQLGPFVLEEIKNRLEERKTLMAKVADYAKHFSHPRSLTAAVDAYRLATHRALVETTLSVPLSFYKAAMYQLKIALFMRDAGRDDEAVLIEALPHLTKAFGRNDSANPDFEYQMLNVLVAVHIRLKMLEGAQSYLGVLEKLKTERLKAAQEDPNLKIGAVEKWVDATKDMWTNREDPDLWKH
jgi:uncharacterized protein (DUF2225 family)